MLLALIVAYHALEVQVSASPTTYYIRSSQRHTFSYTRITLHIIVTLKRMHTSQYRSHSEPIKYHLAVGLIEEQPHTPPQGAVSVERPQMRAHD